MLFRIVQEKRGQATIGFRVQKQGFSRQMMEAGLDSVVWRNKGRRVYTLEDAEKLRTWFENEAQAVLPPGEYEEVSTRNMIAPMEKVYAYAR